ncbi:MAG: hypothetical protein AAB368_05150 [bacterium]
MKRDMDTEEMSARLARAGLSPRTQMFPGTTKGRFLLASAVRP